MPTSFQTQVRGVKLYSLSECGTTQAVHVKFVRRGNRRDKNKKNCDGAGHRFGSE